MSDDQNLTLYSAVYSSVTDALADLDGIEPAAQGRVDRKVRRRGDRSAERQTPHREAEGSPRIQIIPESSRTASSLERSSRKRLRS